MDWERKVRGVCDLVILVDASAGMEADFQDVRETIRKTVSNIFAGGVCGLRETRVCIWGYRNAAADGVDWLDRRPFVEDVEGFEQQLASLRFHGGGETGSLIDALLKLCEQVEESDACSLTDSNAARGCDPYKWRKRRSADRMIWVFSNRSGEVSGGLNVGCPIEVDDVINLLMLHHMRLCLFTPSLPFYEVLEDVDRTEHFLLPLKNCYKSVNSQILGRCLESFARGCLHGCGESL